MPGRKTRAMTHDNALIGLRFSLSTTITAAITIDAYSAVSRIASQLLRYMVCGKFIDFILINAAHDFKRIPNYLHLLETV